MQDIISRTSPHQLHTTVPCKSAHYINTIADSECAPHIYTTMNYSYYTTVRTMSDSEWSEAIIKRKKKNSASVV